MNAKTWRKTWTAVVALAAAALLGGKAQAAGVGNPSYLDINVVISASLSVAINNNNSSTQTVTWSAASPIMASPSSATVKNDSGGYTERWALSTNAASSNTATSTAGAWSLVSSSVSIPADSYSLQAVFGSSNTTGAGCPTGSDVGWNASTAALLTSSLQTYGSGGSTDLFVGTSLNNNGSASFDTATPNPGDMYANSVRALCWRIVGPNTTTTLNGQTIQVIVTAQNP